MFDSHNFKTKLLLIKFGRCIYYAQLHIKLWFKNIQVKSFSVNNFTSKDWSPTGESDR